MLSEESNISLLRFSYLNVIGAVIWIGSLKPLRHYPGIAYPQLINYSVYLLIGFILLASFPMLKIMFPKVKKP